MKICLAFLLATVTALIADETPSLHARNAYAGAIRNPASDDHQHAGLFVARLGTTGAFSAHVAWQGFRYALAGALSPAGTFDRTLNKVGGGTFDVHLDTVAVPGKIIVTVTDGTITSGTDARPALYGPDRPSPWQPKYNGVVNHYPDLGFLPNTDGLVRVSPSGSVRYIARLGDGTICSAGSFLVAGDPRSLPDGSTLLIGDKFPLYAALYRPASQGAVWGDGTVEDQRLLPPNSGPQDFQAAAGAFQWHRPAQPGGLLPNTAGQGAIYPFLPEYHAPAPGDPVVPLAQPPLPPARLTFIDGDLPAPIDIALDWNPIQQFVPAANSAEVRLQSETSEGLFAGTFRHPVTHRLVFFSGVYRPFSGGIGTFAGPDHMGTVWILGLD
jgi:hypothetical protein